MHASLMSVVLLSPIQSAQKAISSRLGKDGKDEEDEEVGWVCPWRVTASVAREERTKGKVKE